MEWLKRMRAYTIFNYVLFLKHLPETGDIEVKVGDRVNRIDVNGTKRFN